MGVRSSIADLKDYIVSIDMGIARLETKCSGRHPGVIHSLANPAANGSSLPLHRLFSRPTSPEPKLLEARDLAGLTTERSTIATV